MKGLTKETTVSLEVATAKENGYVGIDQVSPAVAWTEARRTVARQAEITRLLQARKDFADTDDVISINERLAFLQGI